MHNCDTVLILGSVMPWIDYYPKPGQARGVQVDMKPEHIGLKFPVEVGLTGDMKRTLAALQPLFRRKNDRGCVREAQSRMRDWNALLDRVAATQKRPKLRPQTVVRLLSDLAPGNTVYSMDAGANTHFAARMIRIREGQRWSGTGTLVSMASGLSYAVAAAFAFPDRPSIAVVGDGGFAMLMAELSTADFYRRNVKVLVLNDDAFGEVKFEQRDLGNPDMAPRLATSILLCLHSPSERMAFGLPMRQSQPGRRRTRRSGRSGGGSRDARQSGGLMVEHFYRLLASVS